MAPPHPPPGDGGCVMATVSAAAPLSSPVASVSSPDPAGSPMWRAYPAEIPAGWRALRPVFCAAPRAPDGSGSPDALAVANQGFQRLRAGILLCRPGADERAALLEYLAGVWPEAADLTPEGRYLRDAQARPAYGVLPLAASSSWSRGPARSGECLVLLPCVEFPHRPGRDPVAPIMMFVAGVCVYRSDEAA